MSSIGKGKGASRLQNICPGFVSTESFGGP